jgi:hypothetical protein
MIIKMLLKINATKTTAAMINKKYISLILLVMFVSNLCNAQCPTDLLSGQNLVTNGDFSQGYTSWTHDPAYSEFVSGNSNPGVIYAGSSAHFFNPGGFTDYPDHTATADNMSLMVDGLCTAGVVLWQQTNIPIKPNTTYYFGLWISSLKNNPTFQGHLEFTINGAVLPFSVNAPAAGQTWVLAETSWNSGPTPPATATIAIANTTTSGCATEVDFAVDDISFIPGCAYASLGPQPDLGPDKTICGTGGTIILDANVPHNTTTTVTWSDGTTGTGLAAPYTKTINAAGTYSVCVTDNGSCTKSDIITISNTYSINLGPDLNLCSPPSATLDAGFSGIGVTYQWYKSYPTLAGGADQAKTYFVNTPGTYRVDVTDPGCGLRSDVIVITSSAAIPSNSTYCAAGASLAVSGSGSYKWYDTPTTGTGTLLATGLTYNTPTLTPTATYTYYVEDITSVAGSVGPTALLGGLTDWGLNPGGLQQKISITQDLTITSLKVPLKNINNGTGTITIEIRDNTGAVFTPAKQFTSDPTTISTAQEGTLVQFNFTGFDLKFAWGANLRMDIVSKTINASPLWNQGCGCSGSYPYTTATGIIAITGGGGANATNSDFVDFYNIQFQTGTPCARVPVQATYSCTAPVELLYFTAKPSGSEVLLNWSTLTEINNDHFVIQRSTDGIHFTNIAVVNGSGNSKTLHDYNYTDYPGAYSILYYRIEQIDTDGKSSTSSIETVNATQAGISVYPSPSHTGDALNVSINELTGKLKLSLLDMLGRGVYDKSFTLNDGMKTIVTESLNLGKGVYIVEVLTDGGNKYTERIIIE